MKSAPYFPLPHETPTQYKKRISLIEGYLKNPKQIEQALNISIEPLKELRPGLWGFISDAKIPFYCGALTHLCTTKEGITFPIVQLPKKRSVFRYIPTDELLDHEAVHARRCGFNSPVFEELLAYRTSTRRLRRWFGPLFQNLRESALFLLVFMLLPLVSFMDTIAALYTGFLLLRLGIKQALFFRALKKLSAYTDKGESTMQYLTDREILNLALQRITTLRKHNLRLHSLLKEHQN